jgi:hypothetical protein
MPYFPVLAGPDRNGQFMMTRQHRLILLADRRYVLTQNRYSVFSSTQLFTALENSGK